MIEMEVSKPSRWALFKLMLRSWRTLRISWRRSGATELIDRPYRGGNHIPTTCDMSDAGPPPKPRKK